MAPTDRTPSVKSGNSQFELLYSVTGYKDIKICEYKSSRTGLTVVIADVEGPVVNGFFCVVTEAHDDDGLPHTLEHLIFLGSEEYPYKGVLDLLANRCLASGTNAWTDVDHTCYTMETAGSAGFLTLMPIYLDHILYPTLTEEGFVTEVHHITGDGEDAGVVYCEMQGRENSAESRVHLQMARAIYPGKCGYSSETGGIMKNLRESCSNEKVHAYHREFYRPENLKLIITGKIKADDVFAALEPIETKITSKGRSGDFTRPWQSPVPELDKSSHKKLLFPSDNEENGVCSIAWRGPSAVSDIYKLSAATMLLKYMTDFPVSPLQKVFVETEDPYASRVGYSLCENSISCIYLFFESVPRDKLPLVKPKLEEVFSDMLKNEDINMTMMIDTIKKQILELKSGIENNPHHAIAGALIGHMLYGDTKEDLNQRINPLIDLQKMLNEPKQYWIDLLRKYFVDNKMVSVEGHASIEEQKRMAKEEQERIAVQIKSLGESGLTAKGQVLEKAIEFNDRPATNALLTSVPIPSIESIKFHNVNCYNSSEKSEDIDLTMSSVFTYLDNLDTNFVYLTAFMDTASVPLDLRSYLPLLLETFFESPVKRGDTTVPFEDVVTELNNDTVTFMQYFGISNGRRFKCGPFSQTVTLHLQVIADKFDKGIDWVRELLYQTVFTKDRVRIIATKMINDASQMKRSGSGIASYAMKCLRYSQDSNQYINGIFKQQKFLKNLLESIDNDKFLNVVLQNLDKLRTILTKPENVVLHVSVNLKANKDVTVKKMNCTLPETLRADSHLIQELKPTADSSLLKSDEAAGCIIGMGCLESSFFYQTVPSIKSYSDPDMPALLLYMQYLTQAEGAMWKQIRGKGFAYSYAIRLQVSEGLLYLIYGKATNVVGAYRETVDILKQQLETKHWDSTALASAKSSLIFEMIDDEKTLGCVVNLSAKLIFHGVDFKFNRSLLNKVNEVTIDDLNRVGEKYVQPLLDNTQVRTAVTCDPTRVDEICDGFKDLGLQLNTYPTLEQSFLND